MSSLLQFSGKLYGGRVPAVCANNQPYFRDISDHLSRIDAQVDSSLDTIGTAILVNLSMVTIEQGESPSGWQPGRRSLPWRPPSPASGA